MFGHPTPPPAPNSSVVADDIHDPHPVDNNIPAPTPPTFMWRLFLAMCCFRRPNISPPVSGVNPAPDSGTALVSGVNPAPAPAAPPPADFEAFYNKVTELMRWMVGIIFFFIPTKIVLESANDAVVAALTMDKDSKKKLNASSVIVKAVELPTVFVATIFCHACFFIFVWIFKSPGFRKFFQFLTLISGFGLAGEMIFYVGFTEKRFTENPTVMATCITVVLALVSGYFLKVVEVMRN